jgi:hypothetical protein
MNANDFAMKAAALAGQIAALDDERQRLALQAQEGVQVAQRQLSDLNIARTGLAAELEQVQHAHKAATQREADERTDAMILGIQARRREELRIGQESVAAVARIEAQVGAIVADLKTLTALHEEYGPTLPAYLVAGMAALPKLINHALSDCGLAAFAVCRSPYNTTVGGVRVDVKLTEAWPPPEYYQTANKHIN